jgi:hypothetical protein
MTKPQGSLTRQGDASGVNLPLYAAPDGQQFPVFVQAGPGGHVEGSLDTYLLTIPPQVAGANKLHLDLFNANATATVKVRGIWVIVAQDVAVTGLVGVRLDWFRTSAVGTGGTAALGEGATIVPRITPKDTGNAALPAGVTARAAATGGATSAGWLFPTYHQTEETSVGAALSQWNNVLPNPDRGEQELVLRTNQGLAARQGTVAGVGNLGFLVSFTVEV